MIDIAALTPEQRKELKRAGFVDLGGGAIAHGYSVKSKKVQQGRGENQLEKDFREYCSGLTNGAEIWQFWIKPFILRIGPDMTFEPDFLVRDWFNHFYVIDIKGPHSWEDSRIKIKIAAEKFSCWRWLIVTRPEGVWRAKEVKAEKGILRRYIDLPWLR